MAKKNIKTKIDEATELFKTAAPRAAHRLIYLMENSIEEAIQVKASAIVLERGLGKPVQPIAPAEDSKPFIIKVI